MNAHITNRKPPRSFQHFSFSFKEGRIAGRSRQIIISANDLWVSILSLDSNEFQDFQLSSSRPPGCNRPADSVLLLLGINVTLLLERKQ
ncbi:unnamed protein product [Calypogeia fissa]